MANLNLFNECSGWFKDGNESYIYQTIKTTKKRKITPKKSFEYNRRVLLCYYILSKNNVCLDVKRTILDLINCDKCQNCFLFNRRGYCCECSNDNNIMKELPFNRIIKCKNCGEHGEKV